MSDPLLPIQVPPALAEKIRQDQLKLRVFEKKYNDLHQQNFNLEMQIAVLQEQLDLYQQDAQGEPSGRPDLRRNDETDPGPAEGLSPPSEGGS